MSSAARVTGEAFGSFPRHGGREVPFPAKSFRYSAAKPSRGNFLARSSDPPAHPPLLRCADVLRRKVKPDSSAYRLPPETGRFPSSAPFAFESQTRALQLVPLTLPRCRRLSSLGNVEDTPLSRLPRSWSLRSFCAMDGNGSTSSSCLRLPLASSRSAPRLALSSFSSSSISAPTGRRESTLSRVCFSAARAAPSSSVCAFRHSSGSSRLFSHATPGSSLGGSVPCVSAFLGEMREGALDLFVPGGGSSWMQVRWKKKRGKKEKVVLTAEQIATKTKAPLIRLEDRITPEPPASLARNIRSQISRAVAGWKTKRMFTYRNKYRFRRLVGMTHDVDSDDEFAHESAAKGEKRSQGQSDGADGDRTSGGRQKGSRFVGRTFVTPLTKLQHQAVLPRSPLHARFDFPHTLHYDVFWGPPQVEEEPNKTACCVSFRVADLKLSARQEQRLLDILGPERYDEQTGIACLEADAFPQLNHNAAYLGDLLQQLMREVKKA
ncbi:hypothetical protein BESB_065640 [Besnoitia besnoiti]|uniref:Small ribosomal subunit protein mS35 mitochondrial conserved domain-containing protein n=1 Tax=Besnoitia besnoiti TaxID=94643 RepID=A0A2A9ME34_BESBE|nr:hypothetical protein BESB_065640 [Besnoitia besnoiti]PFH34531.1 hypothetical protein BESB_065640 [Besnoitia besnoiti]